MGWRQRVKKPVAVSRQQNQLILAIDPATLHVLGKLAIELVKLNAKVVTTSEVPTTPVTPTQAIVPNGTLSIPFGTISLSNDTSQNVIWIDKNGIANAYGWLKELLVVNGYVFGINANSSFKINGLKTDGWQIINNQIYADLRTVASTILTSSAVYSPAASA
jgi:hypothetical protein